MAIAKIPLKEFPTFGRRLMELAREKEIGSPLLLAEALYENCYNLVEPAQRKNKYGKNVKDQKHDIEAIKRMVQNHFNEENAYNVQSKYLYAYSKLFNCSLDYLYGDIDVRSKDLEVRAMYDKLHVDEEGIYNLINNYDSDPERFSFTRFWSKILSTDMFNEIHQVWLRYGMEVLQYRDLEKKIEAIRKAEVLAEDSLYRMLMEERRDTLEKIQPGKKSSCEGALEMLFQTLSMYIDLQTKAWVESKHVDLADNYYNNEVKKIKILEKELKEGSKPVKKD